MNIYLCTQTVGNLNGFKKAFQIPYLIGADYN